MANTARWPGVRREVLKSHVGEDVEVFPGRAVQRGEFITGAAPAAGTYGKQGTRWVMANGGVRPGAGAM